MKVETETESLADSKVIFLVLNATVTRHFASHMNITDPGMTTYQRAYQVMLNQT